MADTDLNIRIESSDFPCDELHVLELSGHETMSQLFEYHLALVSEARGAVDPDKLLGGMIAIVISDDSGEIRRVHGMVAQAEQNLDDPPRVDVMVVPRAWRLTMVETLDLHMDNSVVDVIRKKLKLVGLTEGNGDLEFRLLGNYAQREFIVQYKETDLALVSRLAEHLGIAFFFEHSDGRDKIVFSDHNGAFRNITEAGTVSYRGRGEELDIFSLSNRKRMIPATYVVRDYNYRAPQLELRAKHKLEGASGGGVVEYGAHFKTAEEASSCAVARAEERQVQRDRYTGESTLASLRPGGTMTIDGHPSTNPSLLLTTVEHHCRQAVLGHGGGDGHGYENTFEAIPVAHGYRPPRTTDVPRIFGVVTGIIEGPPGLEDAKRAQIDDQGRYLVRFLFDTSAKGERKASRPVRMAQPTVGPDYGMHFPLKPGVEVLIAFIDGDPDRPLIVGAVPNPKIPNVVDATDNTANRIKSQSGIILEMQDEVV